MFIQKIYEASGWDTDKNGKKWEDYDTIVCPDGQVIDMQKLLEEQARARAALSHLCPGWGGLISKLKQVYTFRVSTQATDGFNIYINPQFTNNLDFTGKVFVMAHELVHCLLNHMRRGKGHDQKLSNIAADYETNLFIEDQGLVKSSVMTKLGALYDQKYRGWGYEKIYNSNPSGPNDNMNNQNQCSQAQKNQQDQKSNNSSSSGSGSSGSGSGGSGSNQNQQFSADYKKGWNQAMEDYKNGKLKL